MTQPVNMPTLPSYPPEFKQVLDRELQKLGNRVWAAMHLRAPLYSDLLYEHPTGWPWATGTEDSADALGIPVFRREIILQFRNLRNGWRALKPPSLDSVYTGYIPYFYLKSNGDTPESREHLVRCFMLLELGQLCYLHTECINTLFVDPNKTFSMLQDWLAQNKPDYVTRWIGNDKTHLLLAIKHEDNPSYSAHVSPEGKRFYASINNETATLADYLYLKAQIKLSKSLYTHYWSKRTQLNEALLY